MLAEIKQHVAQLVETNQALVYDLDTSRRIAAELSRERDALQSCVDKLQDELERAKRSAGVEQRGVAERARQELAREHRELEELRRDSEALRAEAEAALSRAALMAEQLEEVTAELQAMRQERDDLREQVHDSSGTMEEILRCLELVEPGASAPRRHLCSV